jgi:hypothetical protein
MPLFRREKLHERLARMGGLEAPAEPSEPVDFSQRLRDASMHGVTRPREWDAVVPIDAPDLRGDTLQFVVLEDGTILEEDNPTEQDLSDLADAVEQAVGPPYRAQAVRRFGNTWIVGARRLRLVEIPDSPGDDLTLAMRDGAHELVVDHGREFGSIPALEQVGAGRESFVVEAKRLDDDLFEYRLTPL